jgi:hypothetical protein
LLPQGANARSLVIGILLREDELGCWLRLLWRDLLMQGKLWFPANAGICRIIDARPA